MEPSEPNLNIEIDRQASVFEVREPAIQIAKFEDDGIIPNSELPVVVYRKAITIKEGISQDVLEKELSELVGRNKWRLDWAWQVYKYIHYHSTAHEALVVFSGNATVQMGGPRNGKNFDLSEGDVLIIPAGVAHECLEMSDNFQVFGIYPEGQEYDMNYGKEEERPTSIPNIKNTALPLKDPIYGDGPLLKHWTKE